MTIGRMNNPALSLRKEIAYTAEKGFDFIEITLEPPAAGVENIKASAVREQLDQRDLKAVGHTAYYLPIASPFASLRRAAVEELRKCLDVFAELRVPTMTVHPDYGLRNGYEIQDILARNTESLATLVAHGAQVGVTVLLENLDRHLGSAENLKQIFDPLPDLGWTLDVGHAHLGAPPNQTEELLQHLSDRLRHLHFSDNYGGRDDLHLPLGTGRIHFKPLVRKLCATGYDGTITLEVFSSDRDYLLLSREKLRQWWTAAQEKREREQAAGAG